MTSTARSVDSEHAVLHAATAPPRGSAPRTISSCWPTAASIPAVPRLASTAWCHISALSIRFRSRRQSPLPCAWPAALYRATAASPGVSPFSSRSTSGGCPRPRARRPPSPRRPRARQGLGR